MSGHNEGINVSGGSLNAGQIAVGLGAQAIQNTYNLANQLEESGKSEVAQAITELLKALEADSNKVTDKEEVTQAVQQVAEEVQKEKPNKFTLKGLLSTLKESVGSVAEIAEKVTILQKAIALMMGLPTL
jgi:translation initiation factor 2B subunit (eIF-2B alpha/beta/delta family)